MTKLLEIPLRMTTGISLFLSAVFAFLAAVTWFAAHDAVTYIAPLIVYTLGSLAILAAAIATLSFCAWRLKWLDVKWTELGRDKTLARNEARQSDIESDRQYMRLQAEGRLMAATVRQVERGMIHPAALGDGKFSAFPANVVKQIEAQAAPLFEPARPELLPALANCPNILIVGGKGRGKTSLLQWLEYDRLKRGNVVTVLDSHAKPSQWAGQVIGAGRHYESIAAAMLDLNTMLNKRYSQRTKGKDDFTVIDAFVDEFTLLPGQLKALNFDIQTYSFPHLTEGRKVGMNCIWGSHSDRAKALGLEGATDLKECFDAIVYLKKVQSDYYAMVDFGEGTGETKYNHPGPFTIARPASKVKILSLPSPAGPAPANQNPPPIAVSNWPTPTATDPDPAPLPKHHPENVNAAIDALLSGDPETFPSKGQVTEAVGVTGGSKYKTVIEIYERRFNEWNDS